MSIFFNLVHTKTLNFSLHIVFLWILSKSNFQFDLDKKERIIHFCIHERERFLCT